MRGTIKALHEMMNSSHGKYLPWHPNAPTGIYIPVMWFHPHLSRCRRADLHSVQQQQARSRVRAVGVDGEVWAEPGAGMGWRHSVPLALSALPIDRGGAQGAVGVNNRPKPKPAAPKGGTRPRYGAGRRNRWFFSTMHGHTEKPRPIANTE